MDKPSCAYACQDSITNPLDCDSRVTGASGTSVLTQGDDEPSPECYVSNDAYLQTLAYCVASHCENVEIWRLEKFWELNVAGRRARQPKPKYSYQEALIQIATPPNTTTPPDKTLVGASLVDDSTYKGLYNAELAFTNAENVHELYGLVLIFTATLIPIGCSLLRLIPFPKQLVSRCHAGMIYTTAFGSKSRQPYFSIIAVPKRGEALFIAFLVVMNVVLSAVGYHCKQPNSWYSTQSLEIRTYVANRFGVLSFANIAISILFAGRNNLLVWITDWSHATFLLYHRWTAFISVLQACLHSAIYLQIYTNDLGYDYYSESKIPYWYWGILATLAMSLLLPMSVLQFRRKLYEIFLSWHIVLSLIALIACYLHIYLRFDHQWGYEVWVYIAFAFWAFDRLIRLLKMAKNGVRTGQVTIIDDDYIKLEIPGVVAAGQAYLYFPSLTWRIWENHPFSVAASLLLPHTDLHGQLDRVEEQPTSQDTTDPEKGPAQYSQPTKSDLPLSARQRRELGLTFFIRSRAGQTGLLRNRSTLSVLVESSYGGGVFHKRGHRCLASYPNLVCITGGVGITAVIPLLAEHAGHRKLYWGVRSHGLVDALWRVCGDEVLAKIENEIVVGKRLDLQGILRREVHLESCASRGTAIVVSGPPSMADEAREIVSKLARRETTAVIGYFEEIYGW